MPQPFSLTCASIVDPGGAESPDLLGMLSVMVFAEFVQRAVDVLPLLPVALCNYLTPFLLALLRKLHGPSSIAFSGTLLTTLAQALKVLSLTMCLWLLTGK